MSVHRQGWKLFPLWKTRMISSITELSGFVFSLFVLSLADLQPVQYKKKFHNNPSDQYKICLLSAKTNHALDWCCLSVFFFFTRIIFFNLEKSQTSHADEPEGFLGLASYCWASRFLG